MGDLVIDVPAESQVHKQVVRKAASTRAIEMNPLLGSILLRLTNRICTSQREILNV